MLPLWTGFRTTRKELKWNKEKETKPETSSLQNCETAQIQRNIHLWALSPGRKINIIYYFQVESKSTMMLTNG